jgi:hypothetical protein
VELVKEAGAILGTGHLNRNEIFAIADFALGVGLKKLLVTHPEINLMTKENPAHLLGL